MEIFIILIVIIVVLIGTLRLWDNHRCENTPYNSPIPPLPMYIINRQVDEWVMPEAPPENLIKVLYQYIVHNYNNSWDHKSYRIFIFNYQGNKIEVFGGSMLYIDDVLVYHGLHNSLELLWQARDLAIENKIDNLIKQVVNK